MNEENLFEQDWRDCLRAHYAYVVREQDMSNERSLVTVLLKTGFSAQDIDEMRAALGWYVEPASLEIEPEPVIAAKIEDQVEPTSTEPEVSPTAEVPAPVAAVDVAASEPLPEPKEPAKPLNKKAQDNDPPEPLKQMSLF